jgi:hypothetical protein
MKARPAAGDAFRPASRAVGIEGKNKWTELLKKTLEQKNSA